MPKIRSLALFAVLFASACSGDPSAPEPPDLTPAAPTGSGSATPGEQPILPPPAPPVQALPTTEARLFRLTRVQYQNTLRAFTGLHVDAERLPLDVTPRGFSNVGASQVTTSLGGVGQYEVIARDIAERLFADPASAQAFVGCDPVQADAACVSGFLLGRLKQAFRRPPTPEQVQRYQAVVDRVNASTAGRGLEFATAAMLLSPEFVYRVEQTVPDETSPAGARYDSHTLASRLSYLLTDGPPDAELMSDADLDRLTDSAVLSAHTTRLLSQASSPAALGRYFDEWFGLEKLSGLAKDSLTFPNFSTETSAAMRTEIQLTFQRFLADSARDYTEIFTTRQTFLNPLLAGYYGVSIDDYRSPAAVPVFPEQTDFAAVDFPANFPRAGLLTRGGIMALNARSTMTSPTLRGIFVRTQLLCQDIPSPPEGVDTEIPEAEGVETQRERLDRHRTNAVCAGCHAFIDPIGLALENFDAAGAYRETEHTKLIDVTGVVDEVNFNGAAELGQVLRDNPNSLPCIVTKFSEHALGRESSSAARNEVEAAFVMNGRSVQALVHALVQSTAFRAPIQ